MNSKKFLFLVQGANGIPDDVCANAFINAVEEFCVERTTHILKRVVFVNLDESATQFFYVLFDQLLNPEGRSELPSGETGTETTEHSVTEPKQEAKESTFHHGEDPSDKDKLMMQKTDTRTTPRHQATVPKQDARRSTGRPVVMIPDDSTTQEFLASKRAVGATPDSHSFTSRNDITKRSQMDKTLRDQDDISETDLKQPFNENPSNAESSATVISRALNETGIDAKAPMSLKHSNEPNVANRESSSQDFLQGRTDKPSQRAHDSADVHIDTLVCEVSHGITLEGHPNSGALVMTFTLRSQVRVMNLPPCSVGLPTGFLFCLPIRVTQ